MSEETVDAEELVDEAEAERASDNIGGDKSGRELPPLFVFVLADTRLALPASNVRSIDSVQPPINLPHSPPHILGLIPHGDGALPVVDLAHFLNLQAESAGEDDDGSEAQQRMMVIQQDDMNVGFLCRQVLGVRTVQEGDLEPPRLLTGGRLGEFIRHELTEDDFAIGVLDLKLLLDAARVRA